MTDLLADVAAWDAETTGDVLDVVHKIEHLAEHQGLDLASGWSVWKMAGGYALRRNDESFIRQPTASAAVRACMERIADELDDTQPLPAQDLDERRSR